MNYSDYDSDGYSSNEDADYVPSDDNLSEDDINECEKEEPLNEDDTVPHPSNASHRKRKQKDTSKKKRKRGVLKDSGGGGGAGPPQEVEGLAEEEDVKQKKKSDDLWASFLSDVGSRPKDSAGTTAPQSGTTQEAAASALKSSPHGAQTKASEPQTVTITKVFDFAGEEVRVKKEIPADSREAKSYLKTQTTTSTEDQSTEEDSSSSLSQPSLSAPSAKRAAGLSGILGRIGGKKQKMSTLEKSKMDWDAFKSEEGITEELAIHNRGREGYVERKNFLERVDHRQFELEKAVRLSKLKQ